MPVFIQHHTPALRIEIVKLAIADGPEQSEYGKRKQDQGNTDENVQHDQADTGRAAPVG